MKKITKAVIPAAGLGTRMLPASKSVPKEMYPVVDKPAIQFLVEEAVSAGITDILIITSRGKEAIENHFDRNLEYNAKLEKSGKLEEIERLREIEDLANVYFLRQKETKGLGHAVLRAREFVGDEPFMVLYGDDIIVSEEKSVTSQMIDVYEQYGKCVVGVKEVPTEQVMKYCSLKTDFVEDKLYSVSDMIEKPSIDRIYSHFAIMGRALLLPKVFDVLSSTKPGAGGEIQLTDAMAEIARSEGMLALDYVGKRYDMGSKLGFIMANIDMGLKHPETADALRKYISELELN